MSPTSIPVTFNKEGATLDEVLASQDRHLEHIPRTGDTVVLEDGITWRVTAVEWYMADDTEVTVYLAKLSDG